VSVTFGGKEFIVELDQAGEKEHLCLAPPRNGIPSFKSLGWKRCEINSVAELSWEVAASSNGPPTDEGGHGNTAMLYFRVTEPSESLISAEVSKTKRIPDLSKLNSVRGRKDLLASGREGTLNNTGLWASEGSGRASGKEESSDLHGVQKEGKNDELSSYYCIILPGLLAGCRCTLRLSVSSILDFNDRGIGMLIRDVVQVLA
jgi:hypothetical protein